ncbi:MAG: hypothetical protein ACNA8N_10580 [Trueperaceae bacterium]
MLGHAPFRIRPWNASTVPATVERETLAIEPVAPRVQATADPLGVRVVPLRPTSPWPARRARERVLSPFRAFPFRAMHLSRLMYADDAD